MVDQNGWWRCACITPRTSGGGGTRYKHTQRSVPCISSKMNVCLVTCRNEKCLQREKRAPFRLVPRRLHKINVHDPAVLESLSRTRMSVCQGSDFFLSRSSPPFTPIISVVSNGACIRFSLRADASPSPSPPTASR